MGNGKQMSIGYLHTAALVSMNKKVYKYVRTSKMPYIIITACSAKVWHIYLREDPKVGEILPLKPYCQ